MANEKHTEAYWAEMNLLAFQGRVARNQQGGALIKVAAPKPYFQVTGTPGEPVQVQIVFGSVPQSAPTQYCPQRHTAFRYPGMERNRTSDRW